MSIKVVIYFQSTYTLYIYISSATGGSLLNYLRKNSNGLTTRQQMGMCRDAAAGKFSRKDYYVQYIDILLYILNLRHAISGVEELHTS